MTASANPVYPEDALPPGTRLQNYTVDSVLGRGAFGITYLATETQLERPVAIKEYLPEQAAVRDENSTVHARSSPAGEMFQYGLDSFLNEAKTLVKFNHQNIVRALTYFSAYGTAYLVMEYEVGMDLKKFMQDNPSPSEQQLLEIFLPINKGLSQVHSSGYIHRDIKADNIYIREDGSPVLLDFGAARDVTISDLNQLTRILTVGYAPYEQDNPAWAEQGPWTDIYALGATLYYCVAGKRPVNSAKRAAAYMGKRKDPYKPLINKENLEYSERFKAAIDKALAFDPKDRPQDLESWNRMLLHGEGLNLSSATSTAETETTAPEEQTGPSVSPTKLLAITVSLAALAYGGYHISQSPETNGGEVTVSDGNSGITTTVNSNQATSVQSSETTPESLELSSESPPNTAGSTDDQISADPNSTVSKTLQPSSEHQVVAVLSEPPPVEAEEDASSLYMATMVLAKTARWHHARAVKIEGLIEKIKGLPVTTDRTRFIVDQQKKLDEARSGFDNNFSRYQASVQQLSEYSTSAISSAAEHFEQQPQYAGDLSYQRISQSISSQLQTGNMSAEQLREQLLRIETP